MYKGPISKHIKIQSAKSSQTKINILFMYKNIYIHSTKLYNTAENNLLSNVHIQCFFPDKCTLNLKETFEATRSNLPIKCA